MVKIIEYDGFSRTIAKVAYVILNGNRCIFSGIVPTPNVCGTVNAAESVIKAITQAEGVVQQNLRWFDLQTYSGFFWRSVGEYEFDELIFEHSADGQAHVVLWKQTECPKEVVDLFTEYIGTSKNPPKIMKPHEARQAGYKPYDYCSPNIGSCINFMRVAGRARHGSGFVIVDNEGFLEEPGTESWVEVCSLG